MAVIDIGSNSVKLLLENTKEKFVTLTRLAEGLDKTGRLDDAAIKRTADAAALFFSRAINAGERVLIFATEAARADGGKNFADLVYAKTGTKVDIISGEQEAECGFMGAADGIKGDTLAVIDVVGASTEVSIGKRCGTSAGILFTKSFATGAVRLFEQFGRKEVEPYELAQAELKLISVIDSKIEEIAGFNGNAKSLINQSDNFEGTAVLIGGTSGALTAIKLGLKEYHRNSLHGTVLSLNEIKTILDDVFILTADQRLARYPFLERGRAEIIPYGIAIIYTVMRKLGVNIAIKSEKGVIEGYLKTRI